MPSSEENVRALREAVQQTPSSVNLRRQLADHLSRGGHWAEAEKEYRLALALAAGNALLKVGLAQAFFQQAKYSQALVVLEDLLQHPDTPGDAYLLHARLLLHQGEIDRAAHQYREALDTDPSLADDALAEKLGLETSVEVSPVPPRRQRQPRREAKCERVPDPVERPTLTFADVGGMEPVKDELRLKIIHPLTHPHLYAAYGKTVGGGILLYGPPGCGKTFLARATAGEFKAGFLPVGINEMLDLWTGQGTRSLHDIFAGARANQPCVLFFDEVDALGSRPEPRSGGQRPLVNQFLAEMDGAPASNHGVTILAATNAPWQVDPAFRRPGRFERLLFVPPPDAEARAAVLRLLCQGKPLDSIDYEVLSRKTEGYSGVDLKAVVDLAVEKKLREALKDGVPRPLTTRELATAAAALKPSTREWFATARNYALYANQGGIYDDILKYLKL